MAPKKRKKRKRQEWTFEDFRVILELPERLARYLREMLHLDKATWDFCLDKVRQYKQWQEAWKKNPEIKPLPADERLYREWSKSKGRGRGRRYFAAPCPELKVVQKAIEQRFLKQVPVHFCRHGNQEGSSILTNVDVHRGALSVYSVDIINAFPTVFRSRVFANLKKPFIHRLRQFGGVKFSAEDVDLMLNSLCDLLCLRDRLPQGPPTSPRILDIVCAKMDKELYELLEGNSTPFQSYRMTAWADDISISSDGEIPEELREQILAVIKKNGFIPHVRKDKTKYFSPETGEVPVVTGLVINRDGRITMAPDKVNQLRARLHQLSKRERWNDEVLGCVNGTLGYIRQIYPKGKSLPSKLRDVVEQCEARLIKERAGAAIKAVEVFEAEKKPTSRRAKKTVRKKATTTAKKPAGKKPVKKKSTHKKTSQAKEVIPGGNGRPLREELVIV